MTLPTLADFTSGAATSAAAVQSNDSLLANTFGAIDIANNISNPNAPMLIGPIRVAITSLTATNLYKWTAPVDVELWELHVSPVPAVDGTTGGATMAADQYAVIEVRNGVTLVGTVSPNSVDTSYTLSMSSSGDRTVSAGAVLTIQTAASGGAGVPKSHANISILAYTKHRE